MPDLRFDERRSTRVLNFFERGLVHTKGRYAGVPFKPAVWQSEDILAPLFGTVRYDDQLAAWVRAYTLAWIELAKKNGKSELGAGVALYLTIADGEEAAEVYGCACDRDQAAIVYRVAKRMCELSPFLAKQVARKRLRIIDSQKRIIWTPTESFYQVVAADGPGNLGTNPHGVIFDEVLTQPNRELWDDLQSNFGTRDEGLFFAMTTAGNDPNSLAAEEHLQSERVVDDPSVEPSRFVYMRNTPAELDWRDEANWPHANPALGDFLRFQILRDEAKAAELSLAKQNVFRMRRLNQWVRQHTRWLDLQLWDENAGMVDVDELAGRECVGGLDLASTADFTAWVLFFPGEWAPAGTDVDHVLARFFLPRAAIERRTPMRPILETWEAEGWLQVTEGEVVDYDIVRAQIDRDAARFRIKQVGYDRWNVTEVLTWATARGLEMKGVAQTTTQLNGPSTELERRLGLRRLRHGGNPILRWMVDNVQIYTDSSGNIKPDRKKSSEKIDGVAALVNGLWCILNEEADAGGVAMLV